MFDPRRVVVAVTARSSTHLFVGTGFDIGPGLTVTAAHVLAGTAVESIRVDGEPVLAVITLRADQFAPSDRALISRAITTLARVTRRPQHHLDVALLVRSARSASRPLTIRTAPVRDGESFTVPAFPAGKFVTSHGPAIPAADDGAYIPARLSAEPGASGAPALTGEREVAGLLVHVPTNAERATFLGGQPLEAFRHTATELWADAPGLAARHRHRADLRAALAGQGIQLTHAGVHHLSAARTRSGRARVTGQLRGGGFLR